MRPSTRGWLIGLLLCFASNASAQFNDVLSRKSLEGIIAFGIVIDDPSSDLQLNGLTRAMVRSDVELRLRRQGMRFLDDEALTREPGGPYLRVIVTGRRTAAPQLIGFVISVQFEQAVLPTRFLGKAGDNTPRPERTVFASTWGVNGLGSAGTEAVTRVIRDNLAGFVDQFIDAYLSANAPLKN